MSLEYRPIHSLIRLMNGKKIQANRKGKKEQAANQLVEIFLKIILRSFHFLLLFLVVSARAIRPYCCFDLAIDEQHFVVQINKFKQWKRDEPDYKCTNSIPVKTKQQRQSDLYDYPEYQEGCDSSFRYSALMAKGKTKEQKPTFDISSTTIEKPPK